MRILVTGGAGFLGSHLVDMLVNHGHTVTIVDNLATGSPQNVSPSAHLMVHDIRDPLDGPFGRSQPEVVIHLAAQVSVPRSVLNPAEDASINIMGYINVLQTAVRHSVRKIILISSAAVYGVPESLPLRETAPLAPLSPYGLSKMAAEVYTRMLCTQHGLTYTILRPSNIYGPRQKADGEGAVIPAFLEHFMSGHDPVIHGDGLQTRDFIYVQDMARGVIASLTAGDNQTLNISSGTSISILDTWRILAKLVGWRREPRFGPARAGDIPHSVMDSSEAQAALGWKPLVAFEEGLARTVEWWDANYALVDAQSTRHA